jgi:hypothetical protein
MRTITDAVGNGPINIFAICDDDGRPTRWSGRSPTRIPDSEGIDAADGRFETDAEPNALGSNKPLGVEVDLDYQSTPIAANDNAATGKAAR